MEMKGKRDKRGFPWAWVLLGSGGILVFSVVLLSLFAPHLLGLGPDPNAQVFSKAPSVTLATEKGEFRLAEHQGEVVLLFFSFPG